MSCKNGDEVEQWLKGFSTLYGAMRLRISPLYLLMFAPNQKPACFIYLSWSKVKSINVFVSGLVIETTNAHSITVSDEDDARSLVQLATEWCSIEMCIDHPQNHLWCMYYPTSMKQRLCTMVLPMMEPKSHDQICYQSPVMLEKSLFFSQMTPIEENNNSDDSYKSFTLKHSSSLDQIKNLKMDEPKSGLEKKLDRIITLLEGLSLKYDIACKVCSVPPPTVAPLPTVCLPPSVVPPPPPPPPSSFKLVLPRKQTSNKNRFWTPNKPRKALLEELHQRFRKMRLNCSLNHSLSKT